MRVVDLKGIATNQGIIWNLGFEGFNHVAVIESKTGSIRSNHYHKTSSHWLYVVSGEMHYYEREPGSLSENDYYKATGEIRPPTILKPGQMIFTGPNMIHQTYFPVDTVIISLTNNQSQEAHEADLVKEDY